MHALLLQDHTLQQYYRTHADEYTENVKTWSEGSYFGICIIWLLCLICNLKTILISLKSQWISNIYTILNNLYKYVQFVNHREIFCKRLFYSLQTCGEITAKAHDYLLYYRQKHPWHDTANLLYIKESAVRLVITRKCDWILENRPYCHTWNKWNFHVQAFAILTCSYF